MPSILPSTPDAQAVAEVLAQSLKRVDQCLRRELNSDLPPVQRLLSHVERYHGKMVRPTLAILAGLATTTGADEVAVTDDHVAVAAVCEMIHLATLVHDDVLDDADTRRQSPTVNSLRGNEAAVILGDYLFSAAYHLCSGLESQATARLIAQVGMTLCAGELLQLHHRENFSLDEATYFTIVQRKTASLIAAACRLGAMQSDASAEAADRFEAFGNAIGIAFQIQDDLLDLTGQQQVVGKTLGKDLENGKMTLPLIHHLASAEPAARARSLCMLEAAAGNAAPDHGRAMVEALRTTRSIEYARGVAVRFVEDAKRSLADVTPSPAKTVLLGLADAVVDRAF